MKNELLGILLFTLLITATILPTASSFSITSQSYNTKLNPALSPEINAEEPNWSNAITVINHTTTTDYNKAHFKKQLGAYRNGLNIYTSSRTVGGNVKKSNPDYVLWVNETAQTYGVSQQPTGFPNASAVINTGGKVSFADDGTIWYTYGGRAHDLPHDLFFSDYPADYTNFTIAENNWETTWGSSTPAICCVGEKGLVSWREKGSEQISFVNLRIYNLTSKMWDTDVSSIIKGDTYGIEQCWPNYDPKYDYYFLTACLLRDSTYNTFGANPFIYSDDKGTTWKKADGTVVSTPINYSSYHSDPVICPHDHMRASDPNALGSRADLQPTGISPGGIFYLLDHSGNWTIDENGKMVNRHPFLWLWNNTAGKWNPFNWTGATGGQACGVGVTDNYLVLVWANQTGGENNTLWAKYSPDDGKTWSNDFKVANVKGQDYYYTSHYIAPTEYTDDCARFFVGVMNWTLDSGKYNYQWIRINLTKLNSMGPINSNPYPNNGQTNIPINPQLSIDIWDPDDDQMTITWYSNTSGTWKPFNTNTSVNNGRYSTYNTNFSHEGTTYWWAVNTTDENGNYDNDTYKFTTFINHAPNIPQINGTINGKAGIEYNFSFTSTDSDGDDVYYWITWGDSSPAIEWIGPYSSGEVITLSHTYNEKSDYIISAKAKDENDAESDWGTLEISMPKPKVITFTNSDAFTYKILQ